MLSIIAIILSSISIILMSVILIRFKKLFSTDSIIEKTKNQMNRVIIDVNSNANRDIELINEATKRTRALLNDSDKKMENFREATQRLRDMIAEAEKVSNNSGKKLVYVNEERLPDIQPVGKKSKTTNYIDPDASYRINSFSSTQNQKSLFDDVDNDIMKDETKITPDGAAYKEVPLIITKIYDDSKNTKSNKPLKERVEKLFKEGLKVEEIATELSCSISEVQFIIEML